MFKKFLCIILAMLMLFALPACNNGDGEDSTQDTTTANPTEEENTDDIKITVADLAKYVVVWPLSASNVAKELSVSLLSAINEKFSLNLEIKTDLVKENNAMFKESEFEILVGVCDREESETVSSELKRFDYAYRMVGTKLVITAISEYALIEAIEHFKTNVIEKSDTEKDAVFFSNTSGSYVYNYAHPLSDIKINGTSIKEYTIVYPRKNQGKESEIATMIQNKVFELTGFELPVLKDWEKKDASGKEIHVGITDRDTDFAASLNLEANGSYVGSNGDNYLMVTANSPVNMLYAADIFLSKLETEVMTDVLELDANLGVINTELAEKISLMSYNIQMWAPGTAGKPEATMQVIIDKNPDLFGLQEATPAWMVLLKEKFGEQYGYVGIGRNGIDSAQRPDAMDKMNQSEYYDNQYNPIFYRKDKFNLIEGGTKWLSYTPDERSKVADSSITRIFTYAVLEYKSTGQKFVFVNTHFDHIGGHSSQAVTFVKYLSRFKDYPIFATGDFNSTPASEACINITNGGYFSSKIFSAKQINDHVGTIPSGSELDYCFTNGRGLYFHTYEVICKSTFNGATPSDHFALYFEFQFCN